MSEEIKEKKQKEFEKLPTSELLNIEIDILDDFEFEAWYSTIIEREPFGTVKESIDELEGIVEKLSKELDMIKKHSHDGSGKAVVPLN